MARYEVGMSFAGEQRNYVRGVVSALQKNGHEVFFDENCPEDTFARWLPHQLKQIYGKYIDYCAVFISEDYARKVFTSVEWRTVWSKHIQRKQNSFILPFRFDKTKIPGLDEDLCYKDLNGVSSSECASLISTMISWRLDKTRIVGLISQGDYKTAQRRLRQALKSQKPRLTDRDRSFTIYNLACIDSLMAANGGEGDQVEVLFDTAATHIERWLNKGLFAKSSLSAEEAIRLINLDDDLLPLRRARAERLEVLFLRFISPVIKRASNASTGQVKRHVSYPIVNKKPTGYAHCICLDVEVDTPNGRMIAANVTQGTAISSVDCNGGWRPLTARVKRIVRSYSDEWLKINDHLKCTPGHRVFEKMNGWTASRELKVGMHVVGPGGRIVTIESIERFVERVPIVMLETDDESHNFFGGGILCHNMKY